jgi:hypothetical protein
MIARIQFSNGKSGEFEIYPNWVDCDEIYQELEGNFKNHILFFIYRASYDDSTQRFSKIDGLIPILINPDHIVLMEIIEE